MEKFWEAPGQDYNMAGEILVWIHFFITLVPTMIAQLFGIEFHLSYGPPPA